MPILAFGTFRLDIHALELRRGGRKVRIRPQPCRLLVLLASRPGQLISRDELRAALWPDVFVRFDLGLNSCLKQIRAALGESAVTPRDGRRRWGRLPGHARPGNSSGVYPLPPGPRMTFA